MQAALIGPSGHTILGPTGLTIGRIQSNQYVVYDPRVSARHVVNSFFKKGYFTITDRGSTNGTFVNGLQLARNVPHILHDGDSICIGDTVLIYKMSDNYNVVNSSTRSHRKTLITILLIVLLLLGMIAISSFEYLNRSTPNKTLAMFCKALQSKDYQSVYDQLSDKLQGLGSEKLIADNLSSVKDCTYHISKESDNFVTAKLTFIGLSGQQVSGTMILIKDSNNSWKINDLQSI